MYVTFLILFSSFVFTYNVIVSNLLIKLENVFIFSFVFLLISKYGISRIWPGGYDRKNSKSLQLSKRSLNPDDGFPQKR